jgi:poly-gamma-glutamate capsule biosynthesis protein CapA/YwtB (metallophosphatase superfamily)
MGVALTAASAGVGPVNRGQQIKVFLAGDVMLGRGIDQILPFSNKRVLREPYVRDAMDYVRLAERKNGPIPEKVAHDYVWGDALDVWQAECPDVRVVNLETAVTTSDNFWSGKDIHYRMHPKNVPCLTAAGVDCCVLANNHVLDLGYAGLSETLSSLHRAGLQTAGAGGTHDVAMRPACIRTEGKPDVLVFGMADVSSGVPAEWSAGLRGGVHLLNDLSRATALRVTGQIAAAKKRSDDLVIASIHWGGNWGHRIPAEQQTFARYLIDEARVDIVHGHSSHHPKAIEIYRGKPIFYGCGDFLNDYEGIAGYEEFQPWLVAQYFVTVDLKSRAVERLQIVPMYLRSMRLERAGAEDQRWLTDKLNTVSREYSTRFTLTGNGLGVVL